MEEETQQVQIVQQEVPKKNKIWIWIFLLFLIIGSGIFLYFYLNSSPCKNINNQLESDNCYIDAVKNEKDIILCDFVSNTRDSSMYLPSSRDYCYLKIYKATKNPSLCEKMNDGNVKWIDCLEDFMWKQVAVSLDASACLKLSTIEYRDTCYNIVAVGRKDTSICQSVQDSAKKDTCLKLEYYTK